MEEESDSHRHEGGCAQQCALSRQFDDAVPSQVRRSVVNIHHFMVSIA